MKLNACTVCTYTEDVTSCVFTALFLIKSIWYKDGRRHSWITSVFFTTHLILQHVTQTQKTPPVPSQRLHWKWIPALFYTFEIPQKFRYQEEIVRYNKAIITTRRKRVLGRYWHGVLYCRKNFWCLIGSIWHYKYPTELKSW